MVEQQIKITNKQGFHMRPANFFIKEIMPYKSEIHFIHNGNDINAKSIMSIMAAGIKYGSEITVQCIGDDEQEALQKAVDLINSGLGEQD